MLHRYKIYRGSRPASDPTPEGIRQDTRKHTNHIVRPPGELVEEYLEAPSPSAWRRFARAYSKELERRYAQQRERFDALAALATDDDVHLGCSCPTKKNPDVNHCHTILALDFMHAKYPALDVRRP